MRLLIVNPNTSEGVTARIRAAAEAVARPGDIFTAVPAAFGPELIVTDEDARLAVEGVKARVRSFEEVIDGIVLASFGDTGAEAVRRLRPGLPVIGIASAAFAAVRALGGSFAIVTFGDSVAPPLRRKVEAEGLSHALMGIASITGGEHGDPGSVQSRLFQDLSARCQDMVDQGATAIVFGGGPLAGLARQIGPTLPVPVIDGTQAAIGLMRAVADRHQPAAARPEHLPQG